VVTLLRALASTAGLVALYYLIPLDPSSIGVSIGQLSVGLVALVGLVVYQVRAIAKATYPALRAVGALATSVPLFLLLFAGTYYVMGAFSQANFSEPLTRTDALYFTVTVFATVGFGDITATTPRLTQRALRSRPASTSNVFHQDRRKGRTVATTKDCHHDPVDR